MGKKEEERVMKIELQKKEENTKKKRSNQANKDSTMLWEERVTFSQRNTLLIPNLHSHISDYLQEGQAYGISITCIEYLFECEWLPKRPKIETF